MVDAEHRRRYRALAARDRRFDGLFFVGVTSTRIYCRPICPARTPRAANCRFYPTAQEAEQAGFRPCLRCRPELAPGNAPIDDGQRIARLIVERLEDGQLEPDSGLERIAGQFELSSRQIRRIVASQLGVPPIQLLSTRRLLLAKQLLTDTRLPIVDVAFASGFASLRRFNDAFVRRYGMPPTRLRRQASDGGGASAEREVSALRLSYRPPLDWDGLLEFLAARALRGVEQVVDGTYVRTVCLGSARGWIRVAPANQPHTLSLEFTHSLAPVLPSLLRRVRALFDLDARPDLIARHLGRDPRLSAGVRANPGLRVPGAFDGFELAVRAVLGQQVTVRAATTIGGRLVEAFGDQVATPFAQVNRLSPSAERLAAAGTDAIARLGIIAARARCIADLARATAAGELPLDGQPHAGPEAAIRTLLSRPGIGPWTAHYIAMRALGWPDAFPKEDVVVRQRLGGVSAADAEALSLAWRPWRSYAVMHLWRMAGMPDAGAARPAGT